MSGYIHLIVPENRFNLLKGSNCLTTYSFNTHTAAHTFCKYCGIKPFYRPRSHPDSYSINLRCLDRSGLDKIDIKKFDGKNWEKSFSELQD